MNIPERIGKYEVRGILGRGAVGMVYKGFDPAIRRAVALKVVAKSLLEPDAREHTVKRFRQEAQAVGRLTHPRITAIYDFIETDELACIVMELVNGKSLAAHLKEVKRYELADTWEILRQVLDGLAYTHGQGVIHRDLKPANILINDDGRIKITDFGVARIDSSSLTQVGDVVGTPHYMAPEQFTGLPATAATDLYQVGVMLYELLAGERPFIGTTAEIMRRVTLERPLDPSNHNHRVSWELDWVVHKALAKDPAERFASARDFSEALRKGLEDSLGKPLANPAAAAPKAAVKAPASLVANAKRIAANKPAAKPESVEGPKTRILFVDDEERILNALQALFRDDYHVFTAESGALALELVSKFRIPIVVSDQRMPGMTGVELLRRVRELNPNAVRMLLTGYSDLAAIVGSINDGEVFRFLKKPWDAEELRATLAEAVVASQVADEPPTLTDSVPAKTSACVLVVDPQGSLTESLEKLMRGVAPVVRALDPVHAVKRLAEREVGVIVAEPAAAGRDGLVALVKLLKVERPEVLSILVTDAPDSETAIELINQARVYRFLAQPLDLPSLRAHVESALRKYARFKQAPVLVEQHRVPPNAQAGKSVWGVRLLAGIRALPERLLSRA